MIKVLSDDVKELILVNILKKFYGKLEDVVNVVVFLVSDMLSYIIG